MEKHIHYPEKESALTKTTSISAARLSDRIERNLSIQSDPEVRTRIRERIVQIENAAAQILTPEQMEVFFLRYRLNGDGQHSRSEVCMILRKTKKEVIALERQAVRKVKRYFAEQGKQKVRKFARNVH